MEINFEGKAERVGTAGGGAKTQVVGAKTGISLEPTGEANVLLGEEAGEKLTTGSANVLIGAQAGTILTKGSKNVYIGNKAGANGATAEENVVIGDGAVFEGSFTGKKNVVIGEGAGEKLSTGGSNILIGNQAGSGLTTTSNKLVVTNNETTSIIQGVMSATEASQELGFFNHAPHKKPEVTGASVTAKQLAEALAEIGLVKVN